MTTEAIPTHRIEALREIVRRSQLGQDVDIDPEMQYLEPVLTDEQLDDLLDILDGIIEERHG